MFLWPNVIIVQTYIVWQRDHIFTKLMALEDQFQEKHKVSNMIDVCHKIKVLIPINQYFWGALYQTSTVLVQDLFKLLYPTK